MQKLVLNVPDDVHYALKRLSAVTGTPMGVFVGQVLEQARPMIDALTAAAEAQRKQQQEALEVALAPLQQQALSLTGTLQSEVGKFEQQVRRGRGRPKKAA